MKSVVEKQINHNLNDDAFVMCSGKLNPTLLKMEFFQKSY